MAAIGERNRMGAMLVTICLIVLFSMIVDVYALTVLHPGNWHTEVLNVADYEDDDQVQVFDGGNQSISDHFHQLYINDDSLLVTARNFIYNISLETFAQIDKLSWYSNDDDIQMCLRRQKTKEECQNYIRVFARRPDSSYLVCGTNAFKPLCRTYIYDSVTGYTVTEVESGVAKCPHNPSHNSTAVFAGSKLYSATVADPSFRDTIIYSKPVRSEQRDSQWLNDPNFVSSFYHNGRVYFFFREIAVENINCGKSVFSRVARVCANDQGGARVLRNTWTSFFKARLNCSLPGEFPFYFDEIQSTTDLGNGHVSPTLILSDRVSMLYAVFTTPRNSLPGSAICAFKMADIIASFEGPHKEQKTSQSNWFPVRESDIPNPHPAKACVNNSLALSDQTLNFIKSHPLMDRAVPAFGGQPLVVQSNFQYSYTQVVVDWQVYAADHLSYDVLFVGTDNGRVLKIINRGRSVQRPDPVIIEDLEVFSNGSPVTGLKIYRRESGGTKAAHLVVMSRNEIRSIPLHRCHRKANCTDCVALKDPYCSWLNDKCIDSNLGLQSIDSGRHQRCSVVQPTVRTEKLQEQILMTSDSPQTTSASPPSTCRPCLCQDVTVQTTTTAVPIAEDSKEEDIVLETLESLLSASYLQQNVKDSAEDVVDVDVMTASSARHSPILDPCVRESSDNHFHVATSNHGSGSQAFLYSSGVVTTISVISVLAALIIGFGAGFYVNSRRYWRCLRRDNDRLWNLVGKTSTGSAAADGLRLKRVNQNPYELDPVKYQFRLPMAFDKCGGESSMMIGDGSPLNECTATGCDERRCSFEPILQRNVGSRCIDEIKLNNMLRTPMIDDGDCTQPRRPPRRNRSIRKEPDG